MNKGFCNPSTKYIFRFSFYIGSFFFFLFFFKNKRETIIYCKQGVFNKGFSTMEGRRPPKAPEQGFLIRYAPKGLKEQRFLQPINQIYFQIFILSWFILFLSLFFKNKREMISLLKTKVFHKGGPSVPITKCLCNP